VDIAYYLVEYNTTLSFGTRHVDRLNSNSVL